MAAFDFTCPNERGPDLIQTHMRAVNAISRSLRELRRDSSSYSLVQASLRRAIDAVTTLSQFCEVPSPASLNQSTN